MNDVCIFPIDYKAAIESKLLPLEVALTWAISADSRFEHEERLELIRDHYPEKLAEIETAVMPDDAFAVFERGR